MQWTGGQFPVCELCQDNEVPTTDKLECLPCSAEALKGNDTVVCTGCGMEQIQGNINHLFYQVNQAQ